MKKMLILVTIILLLAAGSFLFYRMDNSRKQVAPPNVSDVSMEDNKKHPTLPEEEKEVPDETDSTNDPVGLSNPASTYCESNGGESEIITEADGSQFGVCHLGGEAICEEWAYMNGECTFEVDADLIRQALIAKGLDLSKTEVVVLKHFGKYIEGLVRPVVGVAGGGYVYAVKENGTVKVLADGNGAIMCSAFRDYPDYPAYLLMSCVDDTTGQEVFR